MYPGFEVSQRYLARFPIILPRIDKPRSRIFRSFFAGSNVISKSACR
jgi:hypothetical protein